VWPVSELAQAGDAALPVHHQPMPMPMPTPVRVAPRPALGAPLQAMVRKAAFAVAVATSFVLLADSMAARYQRHRLEQEAARAGALETAALSQLRANVKFIASTSSGAYELGLELVNATAALPLRVTAPAVRAYVQVGRQWTELPMSPVVERGSSVVAVAAPELFRYRFEARTPDYARLFSRYMHVRFVSTMLVSADGTGAGVGGVRSRPPHAASVVTASTRALRLRLMAILPAGVPGARVPGGMMTQVLLPVPHAAD